MRQVKHTVLLSAALIISMAAAGCGESAPAAVSETADTADGQDAATELLPTEESWQDLIQTGSMDTVYATEFRIVDLKNTADASGGKAYRLIAIPEDGQQFLLVPDGAGVPSEIPEDIVILQQPLDRTYLAASAVMDDVCTIEALENIRFSGIKEEDWTIPEAEEAMDLGYVLYAGKYNEPDYELILSGNCNLAVENTMIYHNPEVKEKLEELGIPVLVERSSYERNPLGRLEWIRLYGVLFEREEEADRWYQNELSALEPVLQEENTGKTVAFFSVTSNGSVTVRKPGDYISKLIEMAGGQYVLPSSGEEDDNALSTMNMQMEEFYAEARDADILIYNSTIEGELSSMQDLLNKDALFADFRAVQSGDVWCTGKNLYQQPTGMGELLREMHAVFTGKDPGSLTYLAKVR